MITLRPAVKADIPLLKAWDEEPHVQFSDPKINDGSGWEWEAQIGADWDGFWEYMAELDGQPIGFVQIIDPHVEHSQYWGPTEPGFRAIDIWIGPADMLGKGYGTQMMSKALKLCFADEGVHTVLIDPLTNNTDAHRFYQRCGFSPVGERDFDGDLCLVHELKRSDWLERQQQSVCNQFGSEFVPAKMEQKLGIALPLSSDGPVHGLRHPPEGDTTGWYIWTGELSDRENFFQALHCHHLASQTPDFFPLSRPRTGLAFPSH